MPQKAVNGSGERLLAARLTQLCMGASVCSKPPRKTFRLTLCTAASHNREQYQLPPSSPGEVVTALQSGTSRIRLLHRRRFTGARSAVMVKIAASCVRARQHQC